MSKKLILITIVLIELVLGGLFLFRAYKKTLQKKLVLGTSKVASIEKNSIINQNEPDLKYYWELTPNKNVKDKTEWLPAEVEYTYNADGLNDRFNYDTIKPPNVFRIVTLGDSFTYGLFVNTRESWPEQLEDMLNSKERCGEVKFEVINLGAQGFDVQYIVKRFKKFGLKYDPDQVIWLESGSGLSRNMEEMVPRIEECEKAEQTNALSDETLKKQIFFKCWDRVQKQLIDEYTFFGFIDKVTSYLDNFFSVIDNSKVYYISFYETYSEGDSEAVFEKWRIRFPKAHIEARIPNLIDQEALADGHPSITGHFKIAKEMAKLVEEEHPELFKCN